MFDDDVVLFILCCPQVELETVKSEYGNALLECNAADERAKLLASEVISLEEKVCLLYFCVSVSVTLYALLLHDFLFIKMSLYEDILK